MKKKNNYFKAAYWVVVCAIILTGCFGNHGAEEKISVENGNEGLEEEKMEEQGGAAEYKQS